MTLPLPSIISHLLHHTQLDRQQNCFSSCYIICCSAPPTTSSCSPSTCCCCCSCVCLLFACSARAAGPLTDRWPLFTFIDNFVEPDTKLAKCRVWQVASGIWQVRFNLSTVEYSIKLHCVKLANNVVSRDNNVTRRCCMDIKLTFDGHV